MKEYQINVAAPLVENQALSLQSFLHVNMIIISIQCMEFVPNSNKLLQNRCSCAHNSIIFEDVFFLAEKIYSSLVSNIPKKKILPAL